MNEDLKKCSKCDIEKELSEFNFRKDTQKYRNQCLECIKLINKEYQTINKDKIKIRSKEYYLNNRDRIKEYQSKNREKINTRMNEYFKKRKDEDINFKLACNLRKRVLNAFKAQNVMKTNKTFELLGCSHSFLKLWIESQLYGDMTPENYGVVWQLDHCLPIASFNLLDEEEMRKCFNWVNLRPMYSTENNSKGSKIDHRLYLLQQIKANYFMKLNGQERFN